MSRGIILYQSKYGATKKYADWLVEVTGYDCVETKNAKVADLQNYDVIILGGGVYASGIAGLQFIKKNIGQLADKKIAVFAVGASPYDEKAIMQIPDEASLSLLYQCLDIDDKERKILKKLATNKQTIFLIILAVIFSPAVIGIRYCLFKIGKLEDKKFKIMIESIGFVLFALYFRSLKDTYQMIPLFSRKSLLIT